MSGDAVVFFGGEGPVEMWAKRYDYEEHLEKRLSECTTLLAGAEMADEARRWIVVSRQFPIDSRDRTTTWDADILLLDQDGVPTIVEVKRADNRELRRSVIGQILDYATGLRYGVPTHIREVWEDNHPDSEGSVELALLLGGDADQEELWALVASNVAQGRIRLVIAADEIPAELKAVVELLNEQFCSMEIFALGVVRYEAKSGEHVLVPRLAGATAAARQVKSPGSRPAVVSLEDFLDAADGGVRPEIEKILQGWKGLSASSVVASAASGNVCALDELT